jgi:PPM family protein phosphatase
LKAVFSGRTDTGRQRDHNEDAFVLLPALGIAVLADGMGAHSAGEIASEIAIGTTLGILKQTAGLSAHDRLETAVLAAHANILEKATSSSRYQGMGTTIVAVLLEERQLTVAHVGDSRLYRLRKGELKALTSDHSLLQEFIDKGLYSPEEAKEKVARNILTRALGLESALNVDVGTHAVQAGDRYLLCSDGLYEMVSDADLADIMNGRLRGAALCEELIDHANARGGKDNITVVLIET